jgi:protein TonB
VKQPAPEQLAAVAANVSLPAPASASAGTLDGSGSGGAGDGGGAGTGPGTGAGRGGGSGSGVGEGAATGDGLRVWCRTCPAPEYPVRARRQGWEGKVHVDLEVDGDGAVVAARVGESSGFGPLDAAAVAAARRSRFTPPAGGAGLRGRLRYRFVLEDSTRASATTDERRVR